VNPCGKASGKYSPHPNPPPRSSRGQALQAGEGAVCGELTDLVLNILFCELPPVWICAEAFLLNAVPLRLQIFPGQQWAKAGIQLKMTCAAHDIHGFACCAQRTELDSGLRRNDGSLRNSIAARRCESVRPPLFRRRLQHQRVLRHPRQQRRRPPMHPVLVTGAIKGR